MIYIHSTLTSNYNDNLHLNKERRNYCLCPYNLSKSSSYLICEPLKNLVSEHKYEYMEVDKFDLEILA